MPAISSTRLPSSILDPPLILFVDDSLDARLTYSEYLLDAGFQVTTAADGNEGVKLALAVVPRLVLLDLHMPGLDGWEAARLIRSYFPTRPIPIIALSGLRDDATIARAMAAGCNHFVSKPCVPEELVRIIMTTLTAQRAMKERGVT
jgi:two-component system cell cycle response regulator DivK